MTRLLALAQCLCGDQLRRSTFEPLLADWQRELDEARRHGRWRLAMVAVSGAAAYANSLVRCTMTGNGWLPAPRVAFVALATFVVALVAGVGLLVALSLVRNSPRDVGSIQVQAFLFYCANLIAAPVLLPVLFMMRRDPRSTTRHAIVGLAFGTALTAGVLTLTSQEAVNRYFSTFESFERQYQRDLANDRAGRVTYPGTAAREARGPLTLEQRRAGYERFMTLRAEHEAKRPPLTWIQRVRRLQPVALAVLFGVMGWTLAGLGPASINRAAAWWALMLFATLAFGAMLRTLTGVPTRMLPQSYALPLFGAITLALLVSAARQNSRRA